MTTTAYPVKTSFWGEVQPEPAWELTEDIVADVVVVGGGLAGLSTAMHTVKVDPSLRVVLLEQSYVGFGASGRNFCNVAQLARSELGSMIREFGPANARFVVDHQARMFEDFQSLLREEDVECEFTVADLLQVAIHEEMVNGLRRIHAQHVEYGFPSQFMDAAEAHEHINLEVFGGLSTSRNGYAQPFALSRGLLAAAQRHGVIVYEGSPLVGVARGNGDWVATTPKGRVHAQQCVLATNAYTPGLGIGKGVITPTYSRAMATEVLDQSQLDRLGWHPRHRLILDAGLNYWYMQLRGNGQFLMGNAMHVPAPTDGVSIPPHDDQDAFAEIHQEMLRRFPWMEGVRIDCAWGGPLGMTESRFPLTCAVDDGLYVNAAYNGKGVLMATLSGRVLAPQITGTEPDPDYQRYAELLLRRNADKVVVELPAAGVGV